MSAAKHTPGPWQVMPGKTLLHIETSPEGPPPWGVAVCSVPTSHEADADLIAAAPTMLAVLEGTGTRLESVLESRRDLPVAVRHVLTMALEATRAAIAAARGDR